MKRKDLLGVLAEGDYAVFMDFLHSNAVCNVSDADLVEFYRRAPENWKQTLLNRQAPGVEAEKTIMAYASVDTVHLLRVLYGFYPQTVLWAFKEGDEQTAQKVLSCLKDKPSSEVEVVMLKRGESELFKLWIKKFKALDEEAEKLINEDPRLWSLKNDYIEMSM